MTKFHCPNCDTINEVGVVYDHEAKTKYLDHQKAIAENHRRESEENSKMSDLCKAAGDRWRELFGGKKFKDYSDEEASMEGFLVDRYPDLVDKVGVHVGEGRYYISSHGSFSLFMHRTEECQLLELKYSHTITCPTCNYQKKFWAAVDNTELDH